MVGGKFMECWSIHKFSIYFDDDAKKYLLKNEETGFCVDPDFIIKFYGVSPLVYKNRWVVGQKNEKFLLYDLVKGGFFNQAFDYIDQQAIKTGNRAITVKFNDKATLFRPEGELDKRTFDEIYGPDNIYYTEHAPAANWFLAKTDGKCTYYDPFKGKLCKEKFDHGTDIIDGWGIVDIDGKQALFNPNIDKLSQHRFKKIHKPDDSCCPSVHEKMRKDNLFGETWWHVQTEDDKITLYEPNDECLLPAVFDDYTPDTIQEALRFHPEVFESLPLRYFKSQAQILSYLGTIAKALHNNDEHMLNYYCVVSSERYKQAQQQVLSEAQPE